ncbi:hypothetical protein HUN01_11040 [Nostoc edaphicum CCNP1411]|uniref:GNAT family N-acetyltransferase n=1 Tax=Nostoc edaphicum CCNP1411 TaxID=1472755 RepID=A0A7D7QLU1_9NOSO|nr:hypothetical protein [Nostoc edaphicum]QMS88100.1 hypothetical protein HUN01_11040 [Nostoc edaphicum CCNP1411]
MLSADRQQGFFFETVETLLNFAFISAGTQKNDRTASICILEKFGMQQIGRDENLLKLELKLKSR